MTTFDPTIGPLVQQAVISFNASGNNVVVPGVPSQRIKVLQFFLVIAGATNLTYVSGVTPLSGPLDFASNAAQVQDFIQLPLTCFVGDAFVISSTNAVQVGGTIWYAQVS